MEKRSNLIFFSYVTHVQVQIVEDVLLLLLLDKIWKDANKFDCFTFCNKACLLH